MLEILICLLLAPLVVALYIMLYREFEIVRFITAGVGLVMLCGVGFVALNLLGAFG